MSTTHVSCGEPETVGYYGTRSQDAVNCREKYRPDAREKREHSQYTKKRDIFQPKEVDFSW